MNKSCKDLEAKRDLLKTDLEEQKAQNKDLRRRIEEVLNQ